MVNDLATEGVVECGLDHELTLPTIRSLTGEQAST